MDLKTLLIIGIVFIAFGGVVGFFLNTLGLVRIKIVGNPGIVIFFISIGTFVELIGVLLFIYVLAVSNFSFSSFINCLLGGK